jgi:hypothetical protein
VIDEKSAPAPKRKDLGVADPWQRNCHKDWRVDEEVVKKEAKTGYVATPGTPWKMETPA